MAQIETWYNQDLQQAVKVRYIDGNVFSADNAGNIVGVNLFDGGAPATLSGSVSALIIRADGATVAAVGTLSGNQVSVALPQSAYAVPGAISIVLKLTDGTTVTTVLAVVGVVYMSTTDTVVDPGTIIPDITTLVAEIEAAVASIPADYTDLWTSLAPNYSTSNAYKVGQYVTYNGGLYRCVTAIPSGESWTAAHWTDAKLGPDLADLASEFFGKTYIEGTPLPMPVANWKTGYYKTADGTYETWNRTICTNVQIPIFADGFVAVAPGGVYVIAYEYDESGTYIGYHGTYAGAQATKYLAINTESGHKFNFAIGLFATGTASSYLTQTFIDSFKLVPVYNTDKNTYTNRIRQFVHKWQTGYYKYSDGTYDAWTRSICTKTPIAADANGKLKIIAPEGAYVQVAEYDNNNTFVGYYGNFNINSVEMANVMTSVVSLNTIAGHKYNFSIGLYDSGTASSYLTQTYLDKVEVYTNYGNGTYDIETTGDSTDRTAEIVGILEKNGVCSFGPGLFCTNGITMPEGSTISGCGDATELRLIPFDETENLWTFGDKSFTQEVIVEFDDLLPAGKYEITADVTSEDTVGTSSLITFYTGTPYVWATTGSGRGNIGRGTGKRVVIDAAKPFIAIGIYSSTTYAASAGLAASVANVQMKRIGTAVTMTSNNTIKNIAITGSDEDIELSSTCGNRHGIGYYGKGEESTNEHGIIDGCFIHGFTGGGINLYNTGGMVHSGLNICNVYSFNNYCGLLNEHYSEFHRISNSAFIWNYIGVLCNGGNNQFTGCAFSRNYYGFVYDNSSDTHRNGTHGSCVGCIIQHNQICGIYMNHVQSGFMFVSCNLDPNTTEDKGIELVDSTLVIFSACNFMAYMNITITGGGLTQFTGCNFRNNMTEHTTITNNTAVKFTNCFTFGGVPVDPTA